MSSYLDHSMRAYRRAGTALAILRSQGATRLWHYAAYRASEIWWEYYYGIQTAGQIEVGALGISNPDSVSYAPTPYAAYRRAMRKVKIQSGRDVFVDYGAGLGRIVAVASTYPMKRVIGVEISNELAEKAKINVARTSNRGQCPVEIVTTDALAFNLPDDSTILHFFNPFRGETLYGVIDNIRASLVRNPRQLYLLFANPWQMDMLVQKGAPIGRPWIKSAEDVCWAHHEHVEKNTNRYRVYRIDSRPDSSH